MADLIAKAFQQALHLIISGDPSVYAVVYRSLYVAGVGTLLSCVWSIPIAVVLGLYNFRGKWVVKGVFNALIGIPTVALGLLLYLILARHGELGGLHLLYTLNGIALGEAILVTPIIVSFTANSLGNADVSLRDLAKTLGASGLRTNLTLIRETVWSMVLSITAAFNRGFGELGIATIVGGSLVGETQVLTTAISVEINFGSFDIAMAYGIILIAIVIALALIIALVERIRSEDRPLTKLMMWRGLGGG
jgi:tungstate transport system permease protein